MNEGIKPLKLTPEQKSQWGDTMSLMAWTAPGFRHIFYRLLANNDGEHVAVMSRDVPIAATDAKNIIINPDTYFAMGLKERVFVAAHEIVHNVYGDVELLHRCSKAKVVPMHDGTSVPFDNTTMQMAMDFRINALLKDSKIGAMPSVGCYDPKVAQANDSVLDVYKRLYKKRKDEGQLGQAGGFDILLPPGKSTGQKPDTAMNQRNAQQWAVELAAAQTLEQIRSQGKMAGAMQRMFQEILQPKVPWTEHIQSIFNRRVGSGSYNWRRPDRRFIVRDIHMPSRSGHGAGWLVIWGDTSGSIGPEELNTYLGELAGIIEDVRPRRLTILWCDAKIHRIDELEDALDLQRIRCEGVGGGGGTSVMPVMDWIAEHTEAPDMMICFTDGYVTFPKQEPSYPVIWADVGGTKYPWGEVVNIKG
jgi:predicted metal-dependent peptidase